MPKIIMSNTEHDHHAYNSYYVYLMKCSDDSLYCGITTDLERREHEHNHSVKGAKYTRSRRPVNLIWYKKCQNRSEACKEEYRIKRLSKKDKLELIDNNSDASGFN